MVRDGTNNDTSGVAAATGIGKALRAGFPMHALLQGARVHDPVLTHAVHGVAGGFRARVEVEARVGDLDHQKYRVSA